MRYRTINILILAFLWSASPARFQAEAHAENGAAALRLGATLPLTGDIATYGKLIRDGIELAAADLKKGGVPVSVAYEDVPAPGPVAATAIEKLIAKDHIQGLAGNFWNPAIPIMAPAIMRKSIPAFHTAAADDPILAAGDYVFSTNTKIKDEASRIAEYAYDTLGAKTACILYIGTNFGENYQRHFTERFSRLGGKVLYTDLTKLDETDLRTPLVKVQKSPCEVFFAAYFGTNLGLVLKQAGVAGIRKPTLSVYEAEDPSVLEVAGTAAEGLKFFVAEPVAENERVKAFKESFTKAYGYPPRILAANAYDATMILAGALTKCKGDSGCTKDEIYNTKDYSGVSGSFSIDREGAANKAFVLKTVKNGKFIRAE